MRFRIAAMMLALFVLGLWAEPASSAIIRNASGRRTVKTTGTVKITTTTSGQRRIAITIDPDITTAFRLDVMYPDDLAEPVNFGGFNTSLNVSAIEFIEPYTSTVAFGGQDATLLPMAKSEGGVISNIEGVYAPMREFGDGPVGAPPLDPLPNRDDGGSDLFTLYFIDNDPTADKVFTVLGFDEKGVNPSLSQFVDDNYLEIKIDDPTDPQFGQTVRIRGGDIERTEIFVPGVRPDREDPSSVPLPAAVWAGLAGGAGVYVKRWRRRA